MKTRRGFTLVELVVVMAIIGVLAAILIPTMMGYIKKSRLKQSNGNAKIAYNVVSGIESAYMLEGKSFQYIGSEIDCTGNAPIPNNDFTKEVYRAIAVNGKGSGIMYLGEFTISGNEKALFVQWKTTNNDLMVGQFPGASSDIDDVPTWKTYWTK